MAFLAARQANREAWFLASLETCSRIALTGPWEAIVDDPPITTLLAEKSRERKTKSI